MTPEQDVPTEAPPLDALSHDYVTLAFGIERHVEGLVDAYYGPPAVRNAALAGEAQAPAALVEAAGTLHERITAADLPASRRGYLHAQVRALATICRKLAGEPVPYGDEVRLCFDIEPVRTPDRVYDEAVAKLDDALPGSGSPAERMIARRRRFEVTPEQAVALIDLITVEARRRTADVVSLPAEDAVAFALVRDQPWGAYNWYLGGGRSRIEFNTDLPLRANCLLGLVCHEVYPGHHTEHAIKESLLYHQRGYGEQLINTPECVISEGIATLAARIIFPEDEVEDWQAAHVYAAVGITTDPARETQITAAQRDLQSVAANAALMLHEDGMPEDEIVTYLMRYGLCDAREARQRLRFIAATLWRAYIFTYHAGHDLLGAWLKQGDQSARFATLLREQVTPSAIATEFIH